MTNSKRQTFEGICKICQWPFFYELDLGVTGDPDYTDWCTECLNPPFHLKFPKCTPEEAKKAKEEMDKADLIWLHKKLDKKKKKNKNYVEPEPDNIEAEFLIYSQKEID